MKKTILSISILSTLCLSVSATEMKHFPRDVSDKETLNSMILVERLDPKPVLPEILMVNEDLRPKIQIAIILDTSGSMNGLIDQARESIWNIINEVSKANKGNKNIKLEVSLYEYGTSSNEYYGFIRKLNGLTTDIDLLSENLFNLKTSGSVENAGFAINRSVDELSWSDNEDDLKMIVIAGNETMRQGTVSFEYAINRAKNRDIIVNTIYCGDKESGINNGWSKAASMGNGKYFNINQNVEIYHVNTPYDDEINVLGQKLNKTYVGYGSEGKVKKMRQENQDQLSLKKSSSLMASRNIAKSSDNYNSESWDLVELYEKKGLLEAESVINDDGKFSNIKSEDLKNILDLKLKERSDIKLEISKLEVKRADYLNNNKRNSVEDFGTVLSGVVLEQAKGKGFKLKVNK